ncbi:MAG: hypothetical protein MI802_13080 [Desulfobacterales bacterium]|nr:hypothetical protein [Desulfobacterales bacterium]
MKTFIKATIALMAVLVLITPSYAWNSYNESNGTLTVQNKNCGDWDFHIYANESGCTVKEDYQIKNGTTASFTVVDTFDSNRQNAYDQNYTVTETCEYAVEAIGEIMGGYNYSAGDTVVCEMKSSSIFFKACRCN